MNIEFKSILIGATFSFFHILSVMLALRCSKKVAPVLIHGLSAFGCLVLLCFSSWVVLVNVWIAFSVLAFFVSFSLFVFGSVYKSLMVKILCYLSKAGHTVSVEEIDEVIISPTFFQRGALLVQMKSAKNIAEGFVLTKKGKKIAKLIKNIRKLFSIESAAMYCLEPKKILYEKLSNFGSKSKMIIFVMYGLFANVLYTDLFL